MPLNPTERAIEAAGGTAAVGAEFGIQTQTIKKWGTKNKFRGDLVVPLCRLTRGAFQPFQLRPDIFDERILVPADGIELKEVAK